ncbi:TPA: hypothetical protein QDB01_000300 [Burkholderia vietnamiensis]|nr:hypothetical protein [Burkholderia vietnamiensis]
MQVSTHCYHRTAITQAGGLQASSSEALGSRHHQARRRITIIVLAPEGMDEHRTAGNGA